jgi:hypothetical protein
MEGAVRKWLKRGKIDRRLCDKAKINLFDGESANQFYITKFPAIVDTNLRYDQPLQLSRHGSLSRDMK